MGDFFLFLMVLSGLAFGHLMILRRRFLLILLLLAATAGLYALIYTFVGTVEDYSGLAMAIFAMIAVIPLGGGIVMGAVTGWLHMWWRARRGGG
jgi:hypothetical protein